MERTPKPHNGLCLSSEEIVKYKQVLESKSRVDDETGCVLWTKSTVPKGYGWQRIRETYTAAHRISYAVHVGAIPAGMQVCHRCDTPRCINPNHLFLGTPAENQNDKGRKHRAWWVVSPKRVIEMRKLHQAGVSVVQLAKLFGCSRTTAYDITVGGKRPYVTDRGALNLSACSPRAGRSRRQSEQTYLSLPPSLRALHDRLRSSTRAGEDQPRSDR